LKSFLKQSIIVVYSGCFLISCGATDPVSRPENDLDDRGSDCISIRTIRDYTPLDNRRLLIDGGGNRTYYVTLWTPSTELRSAIRIGFSSRDEWLCPYGGDALNFGGLMDESVSIRSIIRVTPEQAEDLLVRYGKKSPDEHREDRPPPELEGAEVEELGRSG
jgi:hypothetical protein